MRDQLKSYHPKLGHLPTEKERVNLAFLGTTLRAGQTALITSLATGCLPLCMRATVN